MRIRIIRTTVCGGRVVEAGEVIEASERDANLLIALKKAVVETEGEHRTIEPREKAVLPKTEKRSK
ncbi:MAG: hypothetical protein KatS3mg054_0654 [Chloroflexus sp.]|nr:MAG: hypothetical protein KatS3mg054_0654 [Chloroflexus sp.]